MLPPTPGGVVGGGGVDVAGNERTPALAPAFSPDRLLGAPRFWPDGGLRSVDLLHIRDAQFYQRRALGPAFAELAHGLSGLGRGADVGDVSDFAEDVLWLASKGSNGEPGLEGEDPIGDVVAGVGIAKAAAGVGRSILRRLGDRAAAAKFAGRAVTFQYGNLAAGVDGSTDAVGNITLRRGMSAGQEALTLRHESVHAFLSPGPGGLQSVRANALAYLYTHSPLLRYTEEALAQGYATRSVFQGLAFPIRNGYIQGPWEMFRLGVEGASFSAIVVGPGLVSYEANK